MRIPKAILVSLGIVAAAGGAGSFKVYNYTQHDPRFCKSCHLMDQPFGRWQTSEHSQIDCHECHESKLAGDLKRLYYTWVDPKVEVETHAEVDRSVCLKCHSQGGKDLWRRVMTTVGHRAHLAPDAKTGQRPVAQCTDCHASGIHRFIPAGNVCLRCHKDVRIHETKMAGIECLSCHDFLADVSDGRTLKPRAEDCRRCHSPSPGQTAIATLTARGERTVSTTVSRALTSTLTVRVKTLLLDNGVHDRLECSACHAPHAEAPAERRSGTDCRSCHPKITADLSPHQACRDCHQAHAIAGSAKTACQGCHAAEARPPATHGGKCDTCHPPHGFQAERTGCTNCHDKLALQLTSEAPKKHQDCRGCHEVHAGKPDSRICKTCHAQQAAHERGAPELHRVCVSCHDPHGGRPAPTASCAKCHLAETGALVGAHAKSCGQCHAPHGAPGSPATACSSCHQDVHTKPGKGGESHRACDRCHAIHEPATAEARQARCSGCHSNQQASLAAWTGHDRCATCHLGHDTRNTKPCASCHATEAQLVTHTKHAECKTCHPPHLSKEVGKVAWWAGCARCHALESLATATRGVSHSNCASCHAPHGVRAKTCDNCHGTIRKQLLHLVPQHQTCQNCHDTHRGDRPSRATCLACHPQKAAHYPKSERCQGCHPFVGSE